MSRPRDPICPRCKIRPKVPKRHYCLECLREVALEWYHKKHPEAKRCDPATAALRLWLKVKGDDDVR